MIMYFCNRCGHEIPKSQVNTVHRLRGESKIVSHYCKTCYAVICEALDEKINRKEEVPIKDEEHESKPCAIYGPVEQSKPESAISEVPDSMTESVTHPYPLLTSDGHDIEVLQKQEPVIELQPLRKDVMQAYLQPTPPAPMAARAVISRAIRTIISFYRGTNRMLIQKRYFITSQSYNVILRGHVSMDTYARWFDRSYEIYNDSYQKIDVGEVLSFVGAGNKIKDIISDSLCDNEDQVFEILEHFLGFRIDDCARIKYKKELGE